jgi:D-alanyl-D-alanine carboxypeptidase/D-alanyl-D-alanine-endopeptidase (penicillin-binding protein 4)
VRGLLLALLLAPGRGPTLPQAVDRLVSAPGTAASFWGLEIRDLDRGTVLYERNARKDFRPASTLKLVATAAGLDVLGKDDRPRTTLETAVPLGPDGLLQGDLFLVGGGDPSLAEPAEPGTVAPLLALADALALQGVHGVSRLVGNEGLFSGPRRGAGWGWEDLVWWYGAEVSALSYADNCAHLTVSPGARPGDALLVSASPETRYFRVESRAVTSPAGSAPDLKVERELGGNAILLGGTLPQNDAPTELRVALEDPARYATTVFREVLERRGIRVGGIDTTSSPLPPGRRVLAQHDGLPLAQSIRVINKRSQNLHAEMLLRLLGARLKGDGSVEAGLAVVQEFLARQGVAAGDWDLEDGSGLSVQDLVTPHGLADLLAAMARHPDAPVFKASLSVAGVDGSLRNRMKGTAAEGRVFAKTGSVSHVAALAGYVDCRSGCHLAVVVIANDVPGKGQDAQGTIDALCALLAAS